MYPSTVNAYFNPPANEVGFVDVSFESLIHFVVDRIPRWHLATSVLLPELVGTKWRCSTFLLNRVIGQRTCLTDLSDMLRPTSSP